MCVWMCGLVEDPGGPRATRHSLKSSGLPNTTISPASTKTEIIRTQSCVDIIQTMRQSLQGLNLQACNTVHCLQNNEKKKLWFLKYAPTAIIGAPRWVHGGRHEIDGAGSGGRPQANAGMNKTILETSEGDRRGDRSGRTRGELRQEEKEGTPPSSVLLDRSGPQK